MVRFEKGAGNRNEKINKGFFFNKIKAPPKIKEEDKNTHYTQCLLCCIVEVIYAQHRKSNVNNAEEIYLMPNIYIYSTFSREFHFLGVIFLTDFNFQLRNLTNCFWLHIIVVNRHLRKSLVLNHWINYQLKYYFSQNLLHAKYIRYKHFLI